MSETRFRVRRAALTWQHRGADLLRTEEHARKALRGQLGHAMDGWYVRKASDTGDKGEWSGPMTRADVLDAYDAWQQRNVKFQVGRMGQVHPEMTHEVLAVEIDVVALPHCTPATNLAHALVNAQFPDVIDSGAFLYRQIDGSSAWSDHAWGTALDESQNVKAKPPVLNDAVFDWVARMGRSGDMEYDYALGSRQGDVMQVTAPDFNVEPSGAASSHLWHVHISVVDHDGRKPPRNPMVK